jgi:hypothetical protein
VPLRIKFDVGAVGAGTNILEASWLVLTDAADILRVDDDESVI